MSSRMKELLAALLLAAVLVGCESPDASATQSTAVHDWVQKFVASSNTNTWDQAVLAARIGPPDSQPSAYSLVVEYYIVAMKRDLPNSMAIVGTTPREYVAGLQVQLDSLVVQLSQHDCGELWALLRVMATHDADETLVGTASEIAWRLSPDRYNELDAYVRSANSSNTRVFQGRREQLEREAAALTPAR